MRPDLIYLDNGPVAKSNVFQNVMSALSIKWQTHIPDGKDGTRVTALAKGKVERPFRTVKAHETLYHFHKHTLTGLKRLMEVVEDGEGRLSVVLAGHPKPRNDLRRPTMEEIDYRTDVFTLDGIAGSQREYIEWLINACTGSKVELESILTLEIKALLNGQLDPARTIELRDRMLAAGLPL
jgi:type II secretory pathway predicted ATPase ExeA